MSLPTFASLFHEFKQSNIFLSDLPEDIVYSVPVCLKRVDGTYDAFFLYAFRRVKGEMVLTRPFAWGAFSAEGRANLSFNWCNISDFASAARFPLNSAVSSKLPQVLTPQKQEESLAEMLAVYEVIRGFAFTPDTSVAQLQALARFKTLFSELVPEGLYPFYFALSPEFFNWIHLPLPQTALPGNAPVVSLERDILEEVRALASSVQQGAQLEEKSQLLIDDLHEELQLHRNELLNDLTRPLERDVIMIIDDIHKTLLSFRQTPSAEQFEVLLTLFEGVAQDLTDLLYRQGVDPYSIQGGQVQVPRQKVISTLSTQNKALDKTVARRIALGWEKEGRIVRPEYVSAFLFKHSGSSTIAPESTSDIPEDLDPFDSTLPPLPHRQQNNGEGDVNHEQISRD